MVAECAPSWTWGANGGAGSARRRTGPGEGVDCARRQAVPDDAQRRSEAMIPRSSGSSSANFLAPTSVVTWMATLPSTKTP
jgi:hypothetical protein